MKQRKLSLPFVLGVLLILCSLCLLLGLRVRQAAGIRACTAVAAQLETLLPQRTQGLPDTRADARMPVLQIDGQDYAALLELPAFGLALPVADTWDSGELYAGPRRFAGSAYDRSLVIGGTGQDGQFVFCSKIDTGAMLTVTDMTGAQFHYTVTRVDRADHAETAWLMQPEYDLTLFCRAVYSMEYIAVRCNLAFG